MFFASNICCVSSGTVNARYCWEPRDVSGAKPFMKKCNRGKGTMFVPSLRKSQFSWPGKRIEQVMPDNPADTKWLRSPAPFSLLAVVLGGSGGRAQKKGFGK